MDFGDAGGAHLQLSTSAVRFGPTVVERHERLVTALVQAFFCCSHSSGIRQYMSSSCDSRGLVSLSVLLALQRLLVPSLELPGQREITNILVRSPFFRLERIGSPECSVMPRHPASDTLARRSAWLLRALGSTSDLRDGREQLPEAVTSFDPWVIFACALDPSSLPRPAPGLSGGRESSHGAESMDPLAFAVADAVQARGAALEAQAGDPADLFLGLLADVEQLQAGKPRSKATAPSSNIGHASMRPEQVLEASTEGRGASRDAFAGLSSTTGIHQGDRAYQGTNSVVWRAGIPTLAAAPRRTPPMQLVPHLASHTRHTPLRRPRLPAHHAPVGASSPGEGLRHHDMDQAKAEPVDLPGAPVGSSGVADARTALADVGLGDDEEEGIGDLDRDIFGSESPSRVAGSRSRGGCGSGGE